MLIRKAVKLANEAPNSWVRVGRIRRIPGGLELFFSIHDGKRGRKFDGWNVRCQGVREFKITDIDGGGLALYPSSHPAARQYVAPRAELRWSRTCDEAKVLAALYVSHVELVDDWIDFNDYLLVGTPWNGSSHLPHFAPVSGTNFVCRGPEFLLRAYAKSLKAIGEQVKVTLRDRPKSKSIRPKVLHFGTSYVVADTFEAQREIES